MARRSWKCNRVYTVKGYQKKRSRSHRKEFVRGGADSQLTIYDGGNKIKTDWDLRMGIMALHNRQISHFTLEAMRRKVNARMTKRAGRQNFHLRIRKHPFCTYRQKAVMAFAGADRLSSGMRNSFGKPIGKCARVKAGQILLELDFLERNIDQAIISLTIAKSKIGAKSQIVLLKAKNEKMAKKISYPTLAQYVGQRAKDLIVVENQE